MPIIFVTNLPLSEPEFRYRLVQTDWGWIAFTCRGSLLNRLIMGFPDQITIEKTIIQHFPPAKRDNSLLEDFSQSLYDYFQGQPVDFDCQIDLSWASDFTRKVLQLCCKIETGKTTTYGQLAKQVGKPTAARAVGTALAKNRVPLVIPCHRIVAANGVLGGYSAANGPAFKKRLLRHEFTLAKSI